MPTIPSSPPSPRRTTSGITTEPFQSGIKQEGGQRGIKREASVPLSGAEGREGRESPQSLVMGAGIVPKEEDYVPVKKQKMEGEDRPLADIPPFPGPPGVPDAQAAGQADQARPYLDFQRIIGLCRQSNPPQGLDGMTAPGMVKLKTKGTEKNWRCYFLSSCRGENMGTFARRSEGNWTTMYTHSNHALIFRKVFDHRPQNDDPGRVRSTRNFLRDNPHKVRMIDEFDIPCNVQVQQFHFENGNKQIVMNRNRTWFADRPSPEARPGLPDPPPADLHPPGYA